MSKKLIFKVTLLLILMTGCARTTLTMKKNNWATRTYHNTTSKYNIYFNGNEAYLDAIEAIEEKNVDDYSQVLPVFEDGIHENFASVVGDMDYAIEKGNKIIQLHSIKKKPAYNPKKVSDPEYREWRNQEEFNKMIDDAYMLIGKATFYKGEFLEAIGVFSHVAFKYEGQDAWYLAHLWMARAYAEMGWLYEAENMLTLVNDENLPYNLVKFYNIVSADFRIKRGEYKEAIPFIRSALEERFKKPKRQRYEFILAQIYQEVGEDELAYEYYKRVVRSIPPYEMEFFSRIHMTEVMMADDSRKAIKKLNKMLKDPKNLEYKGQIYYALGNIYHTIGDNTTAIENYRLSLEFSEELQKGLTATTIAGLYYTQEDYIEAQPYYDLAANNLPLDYPNAFEINYRADILNNLSGYYNTIGDVDREYRLAQMSSAEKQAFLDKEEKAAEREEKILALIADAQGENEKELALEEDIKPVGDWYFYNDNLVQSGKDDFYTQWGDRVLKDNWRRSMAIDFSDEQEIYDDEEEEDTQEDVADTTQTSDVDGIAPPDTIIYIDKNAGNEEIIDAYFNLAALYQYDIENLAVAIETYEALEAQYPNNSHSPDSYFAIYNAASELGDAQKATEAKNKLLTAYPNSNYALILANPNAKDILLQDKRDYNALYEETFALFTTGDNYQVLHNAKRLKKEFRDSTLTSKVLLMEALATAKTASNVDIRPQLERIISDYEQDTAVVEHAQIILANLQDGKAISKGGSAANTLSKRRDERAAVERQRILEEQQYQYEPEARHYLVLVLQDSLNINRNHLQYDVARFNFNKFMTMDFDLAFGKLNNEVSMMIVNGFSNEEEGKWYQREFMATNILDNYSDIKKMYIISEENFRLTLLLATFDEYEAFERRR